MNKENKREKRKLHIKKKLTGTTVKPRVFVFKSNRFFYAGLADDQKSIVLTSMFSKRTKEEISKMAEKFAKKIKEKKIDTCVFDRSGYKYHGLVAAFADDLRNNGIKI